MNDAKQLIDLVSKLNWEQLEMLQEVVQTRQFTTIEQYTIFLQGLLVHPTDKRREKAAFERILHHE